MVRNAKFVTIVVVFVGGLAGTALSDDADDFNPAREQYDKLFAAGRYREAEPYAKRMLSAAQSSFDNDPMPFAAALKYLADLYYKQGRYAEAEPLYKRSLTIVEKTLGPLHVFVAANLTTLGLMYTDQGRYSEAESLQKRSLKIREKALGPDHPDVGNSLNNLAVLYVEQGRYTEAEPLYKRSLQIREKALGPDHQVVASVLSNLAEVYRNQGRYAEAEPLYQRSLRIREKVLGPEHPDVALSLGNLAILYATQGRYSEAEQLYKRALQIREKALGAEHPLVAKSLSNLANLYEDLGRFTEAEPLYRRCINVFEKVLGPGHPDLANSLNNFAALAHHRGRYVEAEPLYKRALQIDEKAFGPENPKLASEINNLAMLYHAQDRETEAEQLCKRALQIIEKAFGPEHPNVATVLRNLGSSYHDQGRYADAESVYKKSLDISEKAFGPDHPDVAVSLNNLALLYENQGRYSAAEPLLKRSLQISEESLGRDHPAMAPYLLNLARLYTYQGRYTEAQQRIDRAIALFERANVDLLAMFSGYRLRAKIARSQDRKVEALADLEKALGLAEQARGQTSGGERERAQLFGTLGNAFEQMVTWQSELGRLDAAFDTAERARSRSLIDEIELAGADLLAGVPDADVQRLRTREAAAKTSAASLSKQIELLDKQPSLDAQQRAARRDELLAELHRAQNELVEVYRDIHTASPAFQRSAGRDFRRAALDDVQKRFKQRGALCLEYFLGDEDGYLFVIGDAGPRLEKLTITAEQASAMGMEAGPLTAARVRQLLTLEGEELPWLLSDPRTAPRALPRLAALWNMLIPESERQSLVAGQIKQLIVVADGALTSLPFETLVVEAGDSPRFLLDVGPPVLYAPSCTVLFNLAGAAEAAQGPQPTQPVLTVGSPLYGAPKSAPHPGTLVELASRSRYGAVGGSLSELPYTATESVWVADVFKKQQIAVGALREGLATEHNVRGNVAGRRVLHFACHGLADQSYGNFFGCLALTPGATAASNLADDGFLTLPEIYELNLKQCELAILSACQTNYGPQQKGEGVWALSRGFLAAGARRVVASNWLVDDEAAASLISVFCGDLAKAEGKGEVPDYAAALHNAKRWVRGQEKWASPYYWGTFVLLGPN